MHRRAKLFVFVKEDVYGGETRKNFWKERGTGDVKLLRLVVSQILGVYSSPAGGTPHGS